jgi:hypothetical protein
MAGHALLSDRHRSDRRDSPNVRTVLRRTVSGRRSDTHRHAADLINADLGALTASTTPADLATFAEQDLDEARSRLTRLGGIWSDRLNALTPERKGFAEPFDDRCHRPVGTCASTGNAPGR